MLTMDVVAISKGARELAATVVLNAGMAVLFSNLNKDSSQHSSW